jgi:hypothetical protein
MGKRDCGGYPTGMRPPGASARRCRSAGGPSVLKGNDDDTIIRLDVHVNDNQPSPRPDHRVPFRHTPESCLLARGNSCRVSSDGDTRVRVSPGRLWVSISSRSSSRASRVT